MPTLKVFGAKPDSLEIVQSARIIEKYDAFLLVEASDADAKTISRKFPVEDITSLYVTAAPKAAAMRASRAAAPEKALSAGAHHYIVQFVGPIKDAWLRAVKSAGGDPRSPYQDFGYVVRATKAQLDKIGALKFVRSTSHLPYRERLAQELQQPGTEGPAAGRRRSREGMYVLEAFDGGDLGKILSAARKLGFKVVSKDEAAAKAVLLSEATAAAQRGQIRDLSTVHGVRLIRQRVLPRSSNNVATGLMGNTIASNPAGLNLTGAGEIVAICDTGLDTGDAATIHSDFAGRIVAIKSYPIAPEWTPDVLNPGANDGPSDTDSGHGTHVSGSVLGDGKASSVGPALIRGHAYKAKLVFQAVEQEVQWKPGTVPPGTDRFQLAGIPSNLTPLFQFAYTKGARIHSNSWGGGDFGAYDDQCRQLDAFVFSKKDMCFVVAAGNDGTDKDGDGKINFTSVTSPATAKNCVTVGACENLRPDFNAEVYGEWWPDDFPAAPIKADPMANNANQVVAFSSRGPTADNRTKPDVVAPGTFILSTRSSMLAPNNFAWAAYPPNKKKYFHMGGTSMATPLTSGALALLREFLRKKRGIKSPSAALLKGLLIAGAERLPGTATPSTLSDPHQGFGRVNLDRSVKQVIETREGAGLKTGQKKAFTIAVPAGGKTLRLVLCYSDFPGDKLVNNLNLLVRDPAGTLYTGNGGVAGAGPMVLDASNNVELVQVAGAPAGTWSIEVVASNVAGGGKQDFAVVGVMVD